MKIRQTDTRSVGGRAAEAEKKWIYELKEEKLRQREEEVVDEEVMGKRNNSKGDNRDKRRVWMHQKLKGYHS